MFLVLGLTGKVGGAVADRLLETGHRVRALVRARAKPPIGRRRASVCVGVTSPAWQRLPPHWRAWKAHS